MFMKIIVICFALMLSTVHCKLQQVPVDTESVVGQEQVVLKCRTDITNTANAIEWHHKVNKDDGFEIVYKRGLIVNGYRGRFLVFPNATIGRYDLVITGVKLQDAGAYTCMDRDSQSKAELIVFQKYPSNDFCMTNSPSDGFLGSNDCGLESDTVRMSCDLSYRGNLSPVLEWMGGETVIDSTITNNADGVTRSSIEQKADQLQTSTYTCRIKYRNSLIVSNLTWSTTLNVTAIKNMTNMSYVGRDQDTVNCSDVNNHECSYIWLSENGIELTSSSSIKLTDKQDGNYTCVATCNIRQTPCSYVAKIFNYQHNQYEDYRTATNGLPRTNPLKICIPVGILLLVVAVAMILAFLFRRTLYTYKERSCLCDRNDAEAEKGHHSYRGDVPFTDETTLQKSFMSLTKQINIFNNGAISSKQMSKKNNLLS